MFVRMVSGPRAMPRAQCIWARELSSATLSPEFRIRTRRWCCTVAEDFDRRWLGMRSGRWDTRALSRWTAGGALSRVLGYRWRSNHRLKLPNLWNCSTFKIAKPLKLPNHGHAQINDRGQDNHLNEFDDSRKDFVDE